ncbi:MULTISPECIES: TIGR00366 family protein [Cecembia]|jgi:short-chain fatty acids transporter|uniref:Short-chain fatty acids transporter n=1 Tax=Cecembia calidifontis TaxID=1187080 RepID=A0A4Q7PE12_9BACT|nr:MULTISPECIES: TIGR00366 family protein [Cecembia]RZS98525.1 short-chain fatty acids transporter [Cecembia calidifontis]
MLRKLKFPSTFEIALFLSLLVFLLALIFTKPNGGNSFFYGLQILSFWKSGFWELLEFTMQMVLILVLGHTLALSKPVDRALRKLAGMVTSNRQAVLLTGLMALAGGYINWGFGLVLGAILARKIGESAQEKKLSINYSLVGASGYLGMLVWHGGLSGSATLKVAEDTHFLFGLIGVVPVNQTIFSSFNLAINLLLVLILFLLLVFLSSKKWKNLPIVLKPNQPVQADESSDKLGWVVGIIIFLSVFWEIFLSQNDDWSFIDLNFVNFLLLGTGLLFYGSLRSFVGTLANALKGATDIIIQFPFYAGILGIMKYSGLLVLLADDMVARSSAETFPLFSFFSAAAVNFFIPSGGGQWAIQGPVMMEAAIKMGLDIPSMILVFAYGDQVSNMLQPFWALPLLSITGIPAKEIFKYTIYFFFAGFLIFGLGVWIAVS